MRGCTLRELADNIGGEILGDESQVIRGVAPVESAGPGDLSFISNPAYIRYLEDCRASALIVSTGMDVPFRPVILTDDPYLLFAKAIRLFHGEDESIRTGIDPRAVVDHESSLGEEATVMAGAVVEAGARIGARSVLFPGVYVRENSVLGEDCVLYPRVLVEKDCRLGDRVILHSGTVVGGFPELDSERDQEDLVVPGVEAGNDIEIGSNSTVTRGVKVPTRVGDGTKMDNQVQIGSEAQIGKHCLLVAQAGIGHGAIVEDAATIAGQVTVEPGIRIGMKAVIGGRSLVIEDVPSGGAYSGIPAQPHDHQKRVIACVSRLPKLFQRVQDLEKRLQSENHS